MIETSVEPDARILVPVDALLDTRMGTASRLDPKAIKDILRNDYGHRKSNDLSRLTDRFTSEAYWQLWQQRDVDTLKQSLVSHFTDVLKTMILQHTMDTIERGGPGQTEVKINLHPYELETSDEKELLSILSELLPEDVGLALCRVSHAQLTPLWIREEKLDAFVVLDFVEWFQKQSDNLLAHPIPGIECFCPELIEDMDGRIQRAMIMGEIDYDLQQQTDPFGLIRMVLAGAVMVTFLPIEAFSLPSPPVAERASPKTVG